MRISLLRTRLRCPFRVLRSIGPSARPRLFWDNLLVLELASELTFDGTGPPYLLPLLLPSGPSARSSTAPLPRETPLVAFANIPPPRDPGALRPVAAGSSSEEVA